MRASESAVSRRGMVARVLALTSAACLGAHAQPAKDDAMQAAARALHEKLLDIKALVNAGISLDEYRRHCQDLILLEDRYTRNGGGDLDLQYAVVEYRGAIEPWERLIRYRIERRTDREMTEGLLRAYMKREEGAEQQLQERWARALKNLEAYGATQQAAERERAEELAKKSARPQKKGTQPQKKAS